MGCQRFCLGSVWQKAAQLLMFSAIVGFLAPFLICNGCVLHMFILGARRRRFDHSMFFFFVTIDNQRPSIIDFRHPLGIAQHGWSSDHIIKHNHTIQIIIIIIITITIISSKCASAPMLVLLQIVTVYWPRYMRVSLVVHTFLRRCIAHTGALHFVY